MSSHAEELGKTINNQVRRIFKENQSVIVELGTITADISLAVPSLSDTIPEGEYMTAGSVGLLAEDDVVLVLWVGNEPVVTASFREGGSISSLTPLTAEDIRRILI